VHALLIAAVLAAPPPWLKAAIRRPIAAWTTARAGWVVVARPARCAPLRVELVVSTESGAEVADGHLIAAGCRTRVVLLRGGTLELSQPASVWRYRSHGRRLLLARVAP
jgi:hypothetical protein